MMDSQDTWEFSNFAKNKISHISRDRVFFKEFSKSKTELRVFRNKHLKSVKCFVT